ncbi:MAG: TIGR02147 family protein [Bdellovibrionales bacterium]|nr:TIGR02147 family protein [Bdellovibrionales bacterium]
MARRSEKSSPRPEIFGYLDYRHFLRDWLAWLRASQSGFSVRTLARKAGLSVAYLSMVSSGKRPLSEKALGKLAPQLELADSERAYLEHLVRLGEAEEPGERVEALRRMRRHSAYRRMNPKETEVHEYLTSWFYVALREMSRIEGFRPDAEWIRTRFYRSVDRREVERAWNFLLGKGFVQAGDDGKYALRDRHVDCHSRVLSAAMAQFHHEMFSLAAESIETVEREKRRILGHTFSIGRDRVAQAQQILDEALAKVRALEENAGSRPELVYHAQFALFPLTREEDPS